MNNVRCDGDVDVLIHLNNTVLDSIIVQCKVYALSNVIHTSPLSSYVLLGLTTVKTHSIAYQNFLSFKFAYKLLNSIINFKFNYKLL